MYEQILKKLKGGEYMNAHNIVAQGNFLVINKHKAKLTLIEQKIMASIISLIDSRQSEFQTEYVLKIKDFMELAGTTSKNYYPNKKEFLGETEKVKGSIIDINERLRSKSFTVINEKGNPVTLGWIHEAEYEWNKGEIKYTISKSLKPYLLNLKGYFTKYRLNHVMSLKSTHSFALYELLAQMKHPNNKIQVEFKNELEETEVIHCYQYRFKVDTLREKFDATSSYSRFSDFKRYVLQVAINEVTKKTNFEVDLEVIKKGRKTTHVIFNFIDKEDQQIKEEIITNNEVAVTIEDAEETEIRNDYIDIDCF